MARTEPAFTWRRNRARLYAEAAAEVERIIGKLPPDLRLRARSVPVGFEDVPSNGLIDEGLEADLMGVFLGSDAPDADEAPHSLPPRIVLFLENIWDEACGEGDIFVEEVGRTYLHEIGHYLGLDEDGLAERGVD